jgi:hypothetical protein
LKVSKVLILFSLVCLFSGMFTGSLFAKDDSVITLPGHTLGDQTVALNMGLFVPLFFQDYTGKYYPSNMSLGGIGSIQWNAYLSSFLRLGLELGGVFSFSPTPKSILMMPFTAKITYLFSFGRFELPIYLGAGINLVKYADNLYNLALILKPGASLYWRFDANLSFGLNCAWWWTSELPAANHDPIMGNFVEITPSLFYHF